VTVTVEPKAPQASVQPSSRKRAWAWIGLIAGSLYLLNFTVGVFELPDYLPIIGNLDEAGATALVIACWRVLHPRKYEVRP
jgi:hypothetical protein